MSITFSDIAKSLQGREQIIDITNIDFSNPHIVFEISMAEEVLQIIEKL